MKFNLTIEGDFEKQLQRASDQARERIKNQVKESADAITREAKGNAPEHEGELKKRIITSSSEGGLSAVVVSKAPHSHLVEFGTNGIRRHSNGKSVGAMPAQPFMNPAVESERNNYTNGIKSAFRR